jgi:hypothetical protein
VYCYSAGFFAFSVSTLGNMGPALTVLTDEFVFSSDFHSHLQNHGHQPNIERIRRKMKGH